MNWFLYSGKGFKSYNNRRQKQTKLKMTQKRLHRKQGILVIKTGASTPLDITELVNKVREERIQKQIGDLNL